MADPCPYPWPQRTIDRATLWSLSRLLTAALWLLSRFRRRPVSPPGPC